MNIWKSFLQNNIEVKNGLKAHGMFSASYSVNDTPSTGLKASSLLTTTNPLPVALGGDNEEVEYQNSLNKYNRTLKRIAKMAGINFVLTSYVVRHTWASIAFSSNIDLPIISRALGHRNTDTTMIYIRDIEDSRLDAANRKLLNEIIDRA